MHDLVCEAAAPIPAATLTRDLPELADVDVPHSALSWPSMMTSEEIALLYRLAARVWSGAGSIVDAGVFLGASTNALAQGLAASGRATGRSRPIVSYDLAIWVKSMDQYLQREDVREALGRDAIDDGASFAERLERLLAPHRSLVDLKIGNILQTAEARGPIEIAFYDCLKQPDRERKVFRTFAPHYVAGTTIILQQDFFYESAAHHKLRQELYAHYHCFLGQVGSTAVFRLDRALPAEAFRHDALPDLPVSDRIALLEQAAQRASTLRGDLLVRLSLLEHLIEIGAHDIARDYAPDLAARIQAADYGVVSRRPEKAFAALSARLEQS